MIRLTATLLVASSFGQSSALLAMGRGPNHAARYVRSYATPSTESHRGAKSQNFPRLHTTTHLYYRQGDQEDSNERKRDHQDATSRLPFSRWWNSICHGNAESEDPSKLVDDYLEFLDRRYHRLHDKQATKVVTFSALNWLAEKQTVTADEQADALYVLGLAGLASDRLLEKHHIPVTRDQKAASKGSVVVEAEVVETPPSDLVMRSSPIVSLPTEVLRKIGVCRRKLIAIQGRQLRAAVRFLIKTMITLPGTAVRAAWDFGGGKKTLTLTCWALITAVVIVRPVVQALVNQKTIHG